MGWLSANTRVITHKLPGRSARFPSAAVSQPHPEIIHCTWTNTDMVHGDREHVHMEHIHMEYAHMEHASM